MGGDYFLLEDFLGEGVVEAGFSCSSSSGMPRMYQIMATRSTATIMKKRVF